MNIMKELKRTLHNFGLLYCPEFTVDFDCDSQEEDTVTPVKKRRKTPVTFGGRPFEEVDPGDTDVAFELVKKYQADKVRDLTQFDLDVLEEVGLDTAKAVIFKKYWYKGQTSKKTERNLKKDGYGYGYGYRTADKYFSAFSSALLRQKGIKRKDDRKSPKV